MSFCIPMGITTYSLWNISVSQTVTLSSSLMLKYAITIHGHWPHYITCFNVCNASSLSMQVLGIRMHSVLIGRCLRLGSQPGLGENHDFFSRINQIFS